MSVKLTNVLKDQEASAGVDPAIRDYEDFYKTTKQNGSEARQQGYEEFNNLYYDLVTDFYEYGWGTSFHFAPGVPGERMETSQQRHQHLLAHRIGLGPGMAVADLGCGIAGPLLEIARFSGAKIVGVNSNEYQLKKARRRTEEAGLSSQVEFLHCDFLNVDAPDGSFDAVYAIEATCCAPDKVSVYGEAFRLLKPGGHFGAYEFCLTDRFNSQDPHHLQIKADIELGGGLLDIDFMPTVDNALQTVGFEIVETRDIATQAHPSIPWYQPLVSPGLSLAALRKARAGRWMTHHLLRALEALRLAPQGSVRVHTTLNLCADAMAEAGQLGIFTPMYFIHGRKPD